MVVDVNIFSIGEMDYAWWYNHHPWPPPVSSDLIIEADAKGLADPLVVQPVDCCS